MTFCLHGDPEGLLVDVFGSAWGFVLCLPRRGDLVDFRCLGSKLEPVTLTFGGGGLAN